MAAWFAVVDGTGALQSVGTVVASPLPAGWSTVALAGPPGPNDVWQVASQSFVTVAPPPPVDRLTDLTTDATYADFQAVWSKLNPTQQKDLQQALVTFLGAMRYRAAGAPVTLTPGGP